VDFVIKLDPDALVIGRFSSYTAKFIDTHTEAGVIGALGCSCNPEVRAFEDLSREPELLRARRLLPLEAPVDGARMKDLAATGGFRRLSLESCRAIHALGSHIDDAIQRGYVSDENIQGGACVIARRMLDRMVERGYLTSPLAWAHIPVGDDRILAMYARAVDLRVVDCSLPGQPFGVQSIGLAYPPSLLLELGYTLIHSIKTDWIYSEDSIVTFFRDRIQAETTYPC
jgi:hypothetical protein